MKKGSVFIVVLLHACVGISQENLGSTNDNYNPVNGQYLNPSNIVYSKTWLDINITEASFFTRNNFAYFPQNKWIKYNKLQNTPLQYITSDIKKCFWIAICWLLDEY